MESYYFLLEVAIVLLSTKVFGILTKKIDMPQVVGALLAGLIMGPVGLGILHQGDFLNQVAEIGVVVLMFTAGLETDIQELKKSGRAAFIIALLGVLVPLAGGTALCLAFRNTDILQAVFLGVVLTATSVSITVETLRELGRLSTRSGNAILGAALIDDILGVIALTVITSMADSSVSIALVLGKIVIFFVFAIVVGVAMHKLFFKWVQVEGRNRKRFAVISFAFCLIFAYLSEELFGVADITGAFVAGLVISGTRSTAYVANQFETTSFMFLSPVFFASIGCKMVRPELTAAFVIFTVLLILVAVVTKIVGCGVGAKLCGYSSKDALRIGVGMVSRGEVALIVASKGVSAGLMTEEVFGPVIIAVVVTTIVTPVLLKLVYPKTQRSYEDLEYSQLTDQYEDLKAFDAAAQAVLEMHQELRDQSEEK